MDLLLQRPYIDTCERPSGLFQGLAHAVDVVVRPDVRLPLGIYQTDAPSNLGAPDDLRSVYVLARSSTCPARSSTCPCRLGHGVDILPLDAQSPGPNAVSGKPARIDPAPNSGAAHTQKGGRLCNGVVSRSSTVSHSHYPRCIISAYVSYNSRRCKQTETRAWEPPASRTAALQKAW